MFESLKQAYLPETDFPSRTIDETLCTRCGRCFETCPSYGFTWQKGEVPTLNGYGGIETACLGCGNCLAVCPADAITITGTYRVQKGRYKATLTGTVKGPAPFGNGEQTRFNEMARNLTEVEKTIFTRRSNRLFKNREIPRDIIERILEAGRFAPSAGNCQPWRFVVITNQALIHELETRAMFPLKLLKNGYLLKDENQPKPMWKNWVFSVASWFSAGKMDPRPMTAIEKAEKNNGRIYFDAPAVILILKNTRGISNPDLDAGICCQNMVLAAHALGLGTCIISLPMEPLKMAYMARFRKKLGIAAPFEAVTSIALGYPRGTIDGIVPRDTPHVKWIS